MAEHEYYKNLGFDKVATTNTITLSYYCHKELQNIALTTDTLEFKVTAGEENALTLPITLKRLPDEDLCWSLPLPTVSVTADSGTPPLTATLNSNYELSISKADESHIGGHTLKIEVIDKLQEDKKASLEITVDVLEAKASCDPLDLYLTEDPSSADALPSSLQVYVGDPSLNFKLPSFLIESNSGAEDVQVNCAPVSYKLEITGTTGVTSFATLATSSKGVPKLTVGATKIDQVGEYQISLTASLRDNVSVAAKSVKIFDLTIVGDPEGEKKEVVEEIVETPEEPVTQEEKPVEKSPPP